MQKNDSLSKTIQHKTSQFLSTGGARNKVPTNCFKLTNFCITNTLMLQSLFLCIFNIYNLPPEFRYSMLFPFSKFSTFARFPNICLYQTLMQQARPQSPHTHIYCTHCVVQSHLTRLTSVKA